MQPWIIDAILTVLTLGIAYALFSEGLWGAALVFFNVLFSSMIALNFYEPLATLIVNNVSAMASVADVICLGGLFLVSLILLKVITENIAPTMVRFPGPVDQLGRLVFALGGAALAMAFLLLLIQTAPIHRKIFGTIDHKAQPPWGLGLDRKLLAFFQYSSGYTFPSYGSPYLDKEFGDANIFDRRGAWLIDHQNARPFGADDRSDIVPAPEGAGAAAPTEGGAPSGEGGGMPMPGQAAGQGPGIPGGTGGAAVGLAPTNP